ncbi:MAG: molybdopterin-dependent oxidoreductase [Roseobacter sp.]|jgi:isoquinoline 1-oxidoreductase beta subunit
MSAIKKIARRGFLIGSAAIAGGVAFGVYKALERPENPLMQGLAPGDAVFNPWVKIDKDKITLILPHADTGQGVAHMQALLIADELDLAADQFETEFGPPSKAYYNHVVAAEGLPFLTADQSATAETMRDLSRVASKMIGLQITGGSTSTPDSFDKLRKAGAVARETLKQAAASKYGAEANAIKTENGRIVLPDGQRVPYQDLAEAAAAIDPVQDVALRDPAQWRLIGKPTTRMDIVPKSTGRMVYGIDLKMAGLLHATVRLSPTRAPVKTADLTRAREMPGVSDILSVTNGFVILADNTWNAMQGALAIEVEWERSAYLPEQEDHWSALSEAVGQASETATWRDDGDVEAGLADGSVEAEYRAPYVAHQPLEPLNATVLATDRQIDIWTATQVPRFAQSLAADISGYGTDQIILHNQFGGGSFGHRLELDHLRAAVEAAVQIKGTPVKLVYSREEDFAQDYPRHIGLARARGQVANGRVETLSMDIAGAAPSTSQAGRLGIPLIAADIQVAAGAWNAPYDLVNFRVRSFEAENLAPVSSWRSVGASVNGFFLEGFLDELIHAAGADPMEERLRLCSWDVARGVLEAVAEMSGWGGASPGAGKGRGVALVESFGVPTAEVVEVTASEDGIRIDNVWVAADVGQVVDPVNFENQVQGGVIWGLGHAINSEITYAHGRAEQSNYYDAEGLRLRQTPRIEVRSLDRNPKIRGIGEPPVPPAAPALANAIFAATGQRLREMPFQKFVNFT